MECVVFKMVPSSLGCIYHCDLFESAIEMKRSILICNAACLLGVLYAGEKNNEKSRNPIAATSQRRRNIGKFIKQRHKFHTQPIIHRSRASC